jgi:hypothetical protein
MNTFSRWDAHGSVRKSQVKRGQFIHHPRFNYHNIYISSVFAPAKALYTFPIPAKESAPGRRQAAQA